MEAMKKISSTESSESFPMNGGDGPNSYVKNSSYQRSGAQSSKVMIQEAIAEELDIQNLFDPNKNSNTFRIVDLGCSVGPNTFLAVQNIIEAIDLKYKSQGLNCYETLEFHVSFSDHKSNDFNTLFSSLPVPESPPYFAAGVPGSFYGRLFPKASLHFVHCSYSLQWLSKVPTEVVDVNSPAWNKGRILYTSSSNEVLEAYSAQYVKDMESFLHARAQEVVHGGLMVLLVPAVPNGIRLTEFSPCIAFDLLGSCLMDLAKMGMISEAEVDSFNFPLYFPSPHEVETSVDRNGFFSIERMEVMTLPIPQDAALSSAHVRAGAEGIIKQHFGISDDQILDQLFNLYHKKIADSMSILASAANAQMFVLLKRNANITH